MGRPVSYNSKSEQKVQLTIKGIKPKEIARILNMSPNSVRVLLWKRRHKTSKMTANEDWNGIKKW